MLAIVRQVSLAKPHSLLTELSLLFDTDVAHGIQLGKHGTRRQSRSALRESLRKRSRMREPANFRYLCAAVAVGGLFEWHVCEKRVRYV